MPGRLEPKEPTRRDFLSLAGLCAAGVAVLGSLVGMIRLPKPRVTAEASSRFRAARPSEVPPGTVKFIPDYKVRLISTEKGIAAISLVCTHLGCVVKETPEGFSCPCHGSKFAPDGRVVSGPAPSPLHWLAVSQAADGAIVVDINKQVKPDTYYTV